MGSFGTYLGHGYQRNEDELKAAAGGFPKTFVQNRKSRATASQAHSSS